MSLLQVVNRTIGSIVYAEPVLIENLPDTFRLFLMTKGILCVRTLREDLHEESYKDIEFSGHYKNVKGRVSRLTSTLLYLKCLSFDGIGETQNVIFRNQSCRDEFYKTFMAIKN